MKESEENIEGWENYRNSVFENKNKSQDDFEKYINILASGGIILSLTFLEKIVTVDIATYKFFYILGILLLVVTLLCNLYSHFQSIKDSDLIIQEIDEKKYDDIFKNIEKRNKLINQLNTVSILSLIIGTLLVLVFVSINLFSYNKKENKQTTSDSEVKKIEIILSENQIESINNLNKLDMSDKPKPSTTDRTGQEVNLGRTTPAPSNSLKPSTPKPSSDK